MYDEAKAVKNWVILYESQKRQLQEKKETTGLTKDEELILGIAIVNIDEGTKILGDQND